MHKKPRKDKHNFLEDDFTEAFSNLFHLNGDNDKPFTTRVVVQSEPSIFEIDSGSPITAISVGYLRERKELQNLKMHETSRIFRTYSGGTIVPEGITSSEKVGKCVTHKLSLILKESAKPIFCKPKSVPFAMWHKLEKELDRLIANGILEPIERAASGQPLLSRLLKRTATFVSAATIK